VPSAAAAAGAVKHAAAAAAAAFVGDGMKACIASTYLVRKKVNIQVIALLHVTLLLPVM
jgi:hypothetical protein